MKTDHTRSCGPLRGAKSGFTLVEVMAAAIVMAFAISSSIIVLQYGMRAIDTARYTTLAGQILQSQMEKLRLLNWTQLADTSVGAAHYTTFSADVAATPTDQIKRFVAGGVVGKCAQSIVDAPAPFNLTMKEITLTATWTGLDGRSHTLSYVTYYTRYGISDFFYQTHL
jgi:prepilin-type N-terminal cleavage/methylation domain-containing protein